jgi:prepilin-type N-terminal cleavage/methylation domain-containing protein
MKIARGTEPGFTMVEVMISVLITAIAAIGFIAMYMTETKAGTFTRHSTEASVLATDKLESLRGINTPVAGSDVVDVQGTVISTGMFTRRWTALTTGSYITLTVQVGWDEDETLVSCSADSGCTSGFCLPTSNCAGRAVTVRGRRDVP